MDQIQKIWPGQAVIDILPVPSCFQQACLSQRHQMLGYIRLALFKSRFQMADTGFSFSDFQ